MSAPVRRPLLLAVTGAVAALALSGCGLGSPSATPTTSAPKPSKSASATPSPSATTLPLDLPSDALLGARTRVTEPGGAVLELKLVAHPPVAWNSPTGTPQATAMRTQCDGEVDDTLLSQFGYHFVQLDVTATAVKGTWPATAIVDVLPMPSADGGAGFLLAGDGGVKQLEKLAPPVEPGDYVPNCLQPGVISGPASGHLYLGFGTDTNPDAATAWIAQAWGFAPDQPLDGSTVPNLIFSGCSAAVGNGSGVTTQTWATSTSGECRLTSS